MKTVNLEKQLKEMNYALHSYNGMMITDSLIILY